MVNAVVHVTEDRVVADSRDVASAFGRQHKVVLKRVDDLLSDQSELRHNFMPQLFEVSQNSALRHYRRYDMDRKGFMLLVMGFTGAEALALKIAWIDEFDRMERALAEGAANDAPLALPDPMVDMREKLLFVREARTLGGRAAGRRAWQLAGLPDVFTDSCDVLPLAAPELDRPLSHWMAERTEPFAGATQASVLYDDYASWCRRDGLAVLSVKQFAAQIQLRGFEGKKSSVRQYRGLKLKGELH